MRNCFLVLFILFIAASATASDAYHLVLKRQGRSQLSVNAAMCDGNAAVSTVVAKRQSPSLKPRVLEFLRLK
jgi:hypothetical protein